jgi:2-keto-4-pentenoate hydratase/2-oxohepta-3-ene-1,7-dioic acid hydratase in catechol pathway
MRRIWCVGRNYLEHIREMGNDERAPPGSNMANMAPWTVGIELSKSTVFGHSMRADGRKSSYHFR